MTIKEAADLADQTEQNINKMANIGAAMQSPALAAFENSAITQFENSSKRMQAAMTSPIQSVLGTSNMLAQFDSVSNAIGGIDLDSKEGLEPILDNTYSEYSLMAEHFLRTEEYQDQSLKIQQQIKENTDMLPTLVSLIIAANEKQDQVIDIGREILSIAKARDQADANTRFQNVLDMISGLNDTWEIGLKLVPIATAVAQQVISRFS